MTNSKIAYIIGVAFLSAWIMNCLAESPSTVAWWLGVILLNAAGLLLYYIFTKEE